MALVTVAVAIWMLLPERTAPVNAGPAPMIEKRDLLVRPPSVAPMLLRPITPAEALKLNAAIPLASSAGPAARPLSIGDKSVGFRDALDCLTAALYYEAATESADGQRAVAQVVLNRVRHPAFPSSVCEVVFEGSERSTGCQFSFTCDGSLMRRPIPSLWSRVRELALSALTGSVFPQVGHATHYHADYVVPYWASSLSKSAVIGRHIFYRWQGHWGTPIAFRQRYRAIEPSFAVLIGRKRGDAQELDGLPQPQDVAALLTPSVLDETQREAAIPKEKQETRPQLLADEQAGALIIGGAPDTSASSPADRKTRPRPRGCAPGATPVQPIQPLGSTSAPKDSALTGC
jgi:spore germination cell wall hydrolase CwlJ-like protein